MNVTLVKDLSAIVLYVKILIVQSFIEGLKSTRSLKTKKNTFRDFLQDTVGEISTCKTKSLDII